MMKFSRSTALTTLSLAVVLVAGVFLIKTRAAQEDESASGSPASTVTPVAAETSVRGPSSAEPTATVATPAIDSNVDRQFAVPGGGVAKKLSFLDKLTQPTTQFASAAEANAYWRKAAVAMTTGGDQVLAAKPTDDQAAQAVQFKVEGLRILAMLGDEDADRQRSEFLDAMLNDSRPEVSSVVGPLRMLPKMRRWMQLDAAARTAAVDNYIADVKASGVNAGQVQLLVQFADVLSDSPNPQDVRLAIRAIDELLPTFKKGLTGNNQPQIQDLLATLEGIGRRLHLTGGQLELEGTLMDGKPLDWDAYRGKVVLVDFWASWCPECIKEVPNVLKAYREYHDKGFEVIGVCLDTDRKLADQVIRQTGMSWPQLFTSEPAGNGWIHPLQKKYAVLGIPRAILVDQKGNVVSLLARGPMLDENLQKLLGPAVETTTSSSANAAAAPPPESVAR